ncbi:MAG: Rrf2 family transcriptional regulator [Oscillospiraceae bacterium]|nr:Rrf2 family transcriptional regulator [Oscillospiraceae bacterium]
MRVSTKGRYALRTMVDLAQHSDGGLVTLKDVAARQDLSQKYLEQIVTVMSRAGYVKGIRGPQGGYRLAREPREYNLAEILRLVEGSLAPVECLDESPNQCEHCATCSTVEMWDGLYKVITEYLEGITLQDLLDRANANVGNDYVI